MAATLDQPQPQAFLQFGNTPRQRGLGPPGRAAGAAETAVGDNRANGPAPRETYELVGPEVISAESVAAIWSEALSRQIRYAGDDLDALEQRLKTFLPAWHAYDLRLMFRRYQTDGAVALRSEVKRLETLLGRPSRGYRDFAQAMAAQWAKS